ncbi:uncharacterized protein LOC131961119 [Centropristis striata]|uniref:uncharacterized protein LOC131961119 n=1 Tax=Centropristis striata TaxID=184440 RepID=UPI0027DFED3A|nr:uncharacterized protein LOC131961119 [Centropristis striata]
MDCRELCNDYHWRKWPLCNATAIDEGDHVCTRKEFAAIFLFLTIFVFTLLLRNTDVLKFHYKVNSTIIVPKVSSEPDMHHSFCTFQPRLPEDALEEFLLLDSIAWPEAPPLSDPLSLNQTSDPAHSTFTILPRRTGGQWHVCDQLEIIIKMSDFHGRPKKSGGDFLLARLHNQRLGTGVVGQVVDHLNGSYSAVFSLLWEGDAQVEVTLVHSSEAIQVVKRLNNDQPDRIMFKSVFRSGSLSETTFCNMCLRPTKQPLCNYTDLRTGEPWFCHKPKKLSCDARISHRFGYFKKNIRASEDKLIQSGVNMKVSILVLGPANVTVLPKKEDQSKVQSSVVSSGPSGYYYQGVWRALGGTKVHQFNSASVISQCLKGKVLHMYGDSTIRQWFEYLNAELPDLKEFNLHSPKQVGPFMALDYANNILVTYRCHGPPIRFGPVQTSQLRYIANELDGVTGGTNTVRFSGFKNSYALLKFLNPTPGPSTKSTAVASTSSAEPSSDAAASSSPPIASTSSAEPSSDAAASSSPPIASTSSAEPSSDAAASSGPPAAPIDPADWPSALTEKVRTEWSVLLKHVKTTLKSWAETRWESRIKSIEAVRYQAGQVREALLEVRETTKDPVVRVEAQSLAEEIGSYRFCICTAIWYDILSKIQHVSKLMQSPSMQLDVAVDLLKKTKDSLTSYRNTGFSDAQTTAKEMCEEMNVEAELKQKRLRATKRHFGYESPDEPIQDALKKMETTFFYVVVDTATSSLDERFQNLGEVNDKFGVLLNFHNLQKEELLQQCKTLSTTLTHDSQPDINGTELAMEMQNFPPLPSKNITHMELLTFLHEKKLAEIYPNMWIALRISATLPVTVAAAERSFSKLKLIKTYLRSTMMQERLSGLSIISINHVVSNQLSYDDVVDDFAARKTRRVRL